MLKDNDLLWACDYPRDWWVVYLPDGTELVRAMVVKGKACKAAQNSLLRAAIRRFWELCGDDAEPGRVVFDRPAAIGDAKPPAALRCA